ncbi:TetR/AcrR family transcriptional regulator [Streptosporangium sp. NBC_01639]|uniref:TetR/AcrR family transcriptional regulator n=1 Tax=unclassified Streptosporangium TaxID=2632669 RepID=UPI002DDAE0BC|nr:TetR/AcrR family transcriptional regulator [Streptosporangium sp. NBC_01756]WSC87385.1 TetR/AcrR family transcriptional regulator [Streptosporangium sp. NBC_01756]WTD53931.1 TetR/AcrR family transcriptional regulator [Streptosporangium sp. NBC_01639]
MARKAPSRSGSWEWSRTAETRRSMLQAAGEVFTENGFADANVADVVARAGSSVGSLYHHFGGKTELFLALWEEHQAAHEEEAASTVAKARQAGVTDPLELFVAGARAFLEGSWQRHDLARLFMDGDGPPGFELMRRTRGRDWVRQNAVLLGAGDEPMDRLTVAVLTTVIGEAGREVVTCETEQEAERVIEAALELISRFGPLRGPDDR